MGSRDHLFDNFEREITNKLNSIVTPTMRDMFAVAALTGMMMANAVDYETKEFIYADSAPVAKRAYEVADAMLEERTKGGK